MYDKVLRGAQFRQCTQRIERWFLAGGSGLFLAIFLCPAGAGHCSQGPQAEVRKHFARAVDATQHRDFTRAEEEYRKALDLDPGSAQVLTNLGIAVVEPQSYRVHQILAEAFAKKGRFHDAVEEYQQVLQLSLYHRVAQRLTHVGQGKARTAGGRVFVPTNGGESPFIKVPPFECRVRKKRLPRPATSGIEIANVVWVCAVEGSACAGMTGLMAIARSAWSGVPRLRGNRAVELSDTLQAESREPHSPAHLSGLLSGQLAGG